MCETPNTLFKETLRFIATWFGSTGHWFNWIIYNFLLPSGLICTICNLWQFTLLIFFVLAIYGQCDMMWKIRPFPSLYLAVTSLSIKSNQINLYLCSAFHTKKAVPSALHRLKTIKQTTTEQEKQQIKSRETANKISLSMIC